MNHQDAKTPRKAENVSVEVDAIARSVVDAAFKVHTALGPGLMESAYEACMKIELKRRGLPFAAQVALPLVYRGETVEPGYRLDLLAADTVIVEIKAVEKLLPVHEAQLLTYIKLACVPLGFLINFNVPLIKQGIRRFVL